jgi:protein-S-isoprenylcysteine O-methyltransferase Ste14
MAEHRDAAGVGLPAPAIFAGLFIIGLALNWAIPAVALPPGARTLGWALLIAGFVAIGLPGIIALRRAGTSPNPRRPTTALVVTGPYRFTRHPLYLSMTIIYAGLALAVNAVVALVLLPVAVALIDRGPMVREERYMEQKFGDAYRAYKARVRRWL